MSSTYPIYYRGTLIDIAYGKRINLVIKTGTEYPEKRKEFPGILRELSGVFKNRIANTLFLDNLSEEDIESIKLTIPEVNRGLVETVILSKRDTNPASVVLLHLYTGVQKRGKMSFFLMGELWETEGIMT